MALVKCCIGREVAAFYYSANKDYYTYIFFKIRSLMTEIKQFNNEGTVFGSIGKSDFEALGITIPPQSLILDFEKSSKPLNDKVIENCNQTRTLESLRRQGKDAINRVYTEEKVFPASLRFHTWPTDFS